MSEVTLYMDWMLAQNRHSGRTRGCATGSGVAESYMKRLLNQNSLAIKFTTQHVLD